MTDKEEEVLTGIVEKASKGGWEVDDSPHIITNYNIRYGKISFNIYDTKYNEALTKQFSIPDLIDNDDFMRAVFGCGDNKCKKCGEKRSLSYYKTYLISKVVCKKCGEINEYVPFQYHQQQLIVLPRSGQIGYLKRFMEE